jgi:hypothetical protein
MQDVAVRNLPDAVIFRHKAHRIAPFVSALRTDQKDFNLLGIFQIAFGAVWQIAHDVFFEIFRKSIEQRNNGF